MEDLKLEKNGQYLSQIKEDVSSYKSFKKNVQYANLFKATISRINPSIEFIDDKHIVGVSISYEGIETEEIKIGSSYINVITGISSSGVSLTFEETRDEAVKKFLLMDDEKPIIPKDGTYLLAEDFYFEIEVMSVPLAGDESENFLIRGDFILDGQLEKSLQTGEASFLTTTATFKAMNSQGVEYQ